MLALEDDTIQRYGWAILQTQQLDPITQSGVFIIANKAASRRVVEEDGQRYSEGTGFHAPVRGLVAIAPNLLP